MSKSRSISRQSTAESGLLAHAPIRTVEAGAHLFHQGDPATAIYFIEEGRLRLERTTTTGTTIVLHNARPGEFLAEAALFSDAYHCNAVAMERSRVRVYEKSAALVGLEPASAGRELLAFMAAQLQRLRARLELRNVRSAKERVMLFLEARADPAGEIGLHGELQEIAEDLGLTREALYRALAALSAEGRIERSPGRIALQRVRR